MQKNIEQIIYEMYEDNYNQEIFDEFLPMLVIMMEDEDGKMIPTITMDAIIELNLEKKVIDFFIKYLEDNGIKIIFNKEFDDENNFCHDYESYYLKKKKTLPPRIKQNETIKKFNLLRKYNNNEIREQIILGNMYIVAYFAWYYSNKFSIDIDDIEQYGYEGLIFAVDHFNPEKEKDFFLYARVCIKGFIKRGVSFSINNDIPLNLSVYIQKIVNIVEKENGIKLEEDLTLISKIADLLVEKGIVNIKNRDQCIQAINLMYNNRSVEELLMEDTDILVNFDVENMINLEKARLIQILGILSEREQEIITLHYGLNDTVACTLNEIGKKRKVTREMVRLYEKKAFESIHRTSVLRRIKSMWQDEVFSRSLTDDYMETHHVLKK